MKLNDEAKEKWMSDWRKNYEGETSFKQGYGQGERNNTQAFVEGVVELSKHIALNSTTATTTVQTNEQGITQVVINVVPRA